MPLRTTLPSWSARTLRFAAAILLCASARAQTPLLDITNTVAASDQGVPVQQSFPITATGTYQLTLTDLGATLSPSAPLASVKLAVTNGSTVVGSPLVGAGTMQFTAATPGTYWVRVIGKPGTKPGSGPFGVQITQTSNSSQVLAFSGSLAPPPQAVPSTEDVLDDSFTVQAPGNYQVSLTDLKLPQSLGTLTLLLTAPGAAAPLAILPDQTNSFTTTVQLQPGTAYRIFAIAQTTSTTSGGLYSAVVTGGGAVAYNKTRPVGGVADLGPATLTAGTTYNLGVADLQFPTALSSVSAVVVMNGQELAPPSSGPTSPITASSAGSSEVFAYAAPASSANGGSYSAILQPQPSQQGAGTPVLSVARAVTTPSSATRGYSFDATVATAGAYSFNLADFSVPSAFGSLQGAVAQGGALLGTPLNGAGNASATESVTAAAGPLSIIVFAQPGNGGSLFGADLAASGAAPAVQVTQGVGQLFSSQKFTVPAAGNYAVTVTDVGFPAPLQTLAAVVTQGVTNVGSIYTGGTFGFTAAAAGDYIVNFVAQPQTAPASTDEAGTYSIQASPAPPAPTVTLTANPTSVASGGTVTLTWTAQSATSCTATGGWSGSLAATGGNQTSPNLTAATTFTITCYNSAQVSSKASVTVNLASSSSSGGGSHGGGAIDGGLLALLAGVLLLRARLPARMGRLAWVRSISLH